MLSATELASMRAQALAALPDTCSIVAMTLTPDGHLGQNATETVVAANVPCRLEELGESNQRDFELGGRIASRGGTLVRLPWNVALDETHTIAIGTRRLPVQRVIRKSYATVLTAIVSDVR